MKIKNFEYHKASGETSDRKVIVLHPAKDYDHTIDISDVEIPLAQDILISELERIHAEHALAMRELLVQFGLENKLRNFKINRMYNITEEEV